MELTPLTIYLIFTADRIGGLFFILSLVGCFVTGFGVISSAVEGEFNVTKTFAKFGIPFCVTCVIATTLLPSTKVLVAMYGIPAAIEGAKEVATSDVGKKAYSAVNKLLDDYIATKPAK